MAVNVARQGLALIDGTERTARKLENGTIQYNNRSNWRKGKWLDITDSVATGLAEFTWVDGDAPADQPTPIRSAEDFVAAATDILNGQATSEDYATPDEADEADEVEVAQPVQGDAPYAVTAMGAKVQLHFPVGEGAYVATRYFATLDEVDAFLASDLRSAWAVSVKDGSVWKRRGVHQLQVWHEGRQIKTYDPRPVKP